MGQAIRTKQVKTKDTFVGRVLVGCKERIRSFYNKKTKENGEVTEFKGSFQSSNGTNFGIKVSPSSEEKYKSTGVAYWVEVSEFKTNSRR